MSIIELSAATFSAKKSGRSNIFTLLHFVIHKKRAVTGNKSSQLKWFDIIFCWMMDHCWQGASLCNPVMISNQVTTTCLCKHLNWEEDDGLNVTLCKNSHSLKYYVTTYKVTNREVNLYTLFFLFWFSVKMVIRVVSVCIECRGCRAKCRLDISTLD